MYKFYHATCYVTNLYPGTDICKLTPSEARQNTTFTWLEHASLSTKNVTNLVGTGGYYVKF